MAGRLGLSLGLWAIIAGGSARGIEGPATAPAAAVVAPSTGQSGDAEVRYSGRPTVGSRVTIGPNGPDDPELTYRWRQVEGPPVAIANPGQAKIEFVVPAEARQLAFLLTVRNQGGQERSVRIVVPVHAEVEPAASAGQTQEVPQVPEPQTGPRAHAGDDQVGLVGRRITLNGSRSTPGAGCRWFQIVGPKVSQPVQEGYYYSFVPTAPGFCKFGLIVAQGSTLSEPDEVEVVVGEYPAPAPNSTPAMPVPASSLPAATLPAMGPADAPVAGRVAGVLDAITARVDLYTSFEELASELQRGLDGVVPQEPGPRQLWVQGVFAPLSQQTMAELATVGLDLRWPQAYRQPLTPPQKDRIQRLFRAYATEFRSRAQAR